MSHSAQLLQTCEISSSLNPMKQQLLVSLNLKVCIFKEEMEGGGQVSKYNPLQIHPSPKI